MPYAFSIGQVINGNTIIALPTGSGVYGGMYQLQRADSSTFYDSLTSEQLASGWVNILVNDDNVNASNPLPVYIASGSSGGGAIGTTTTPNVSTLSDPTTPTHQASIMAPGSTSAYLVGIQGTPGALPVGVSNSALPLPTGAATSAKQPALGTSGTPSADVLTIQGSSSETPIPMSAASLPLPAGAATSAKQPALGTVGSPSVDVLTIQGSSSATPIPMSAASLPLPAGAATSAKQPALGTVGSPSVDVLTIQGSSSSTPIPMSAASLPLPAGAATSAKQPALGTVGTPSADVLTIQGSSSATPIPVSIATAPALVASTANIGNVGGKTAKIATALTVTASSAYTTGNVVGGKITFSSALLTAGSGVLESISLRSKSVQTATFTLFLFDSNPTNTTWTDKTAPSINVADIPFLVGAYQLSSYSSGLGTHTIYTLNGISQALAAGATTLYGILVVAGTPTFTATTDLTVVLGILQD